MKDEGPSRRNMGISVTSRVAAPGRSGVLRPFCVALLLLSAGGCSISEHIYRDRPSTAPYPKTAVIPAVIPPNPMNAVEVSMARTKLDEAGEQHSQQAIEQIENTGR